VSHACAQGLRAETRLGSKNLDDIQSSEGIDKTTGHDDSSPDDYQPSKNTNSNNKPPK